MKQFFLFVWICLISLVLIAGPQKDGPWVVRVYFSDWQQAEPIASRLAAWEVNRSEGYFVVDADVELVEHLSDHGFAMEIDPKLTDLYFRMSRDLENQTEHIPSFPCYRTVEETYTSAEDLVNTYPTLVEWIHIGDSWDKTQGRGGYDLMVLKITNQDIVAEKPDLWVMSAIHAREYATAELNIRFAEYLLNNYGTDPDATWIIDNREIHLLLMANPDGRKMAENGLSWRKNTNDDFCEGGSSYGIDLNRNYPFEWGCCGGSSGDPCDPTYRGTAAMSEPETQAVIAYTQSIFEDQRGPDLLDAAPIDTHGVFLDLHSYGQLVLWSWGFTATVPPNGDGLQTFGRKLCFFNDYEPSQSSTGLYFTDGTTKDYSYGEFGIPSYTVEMGTNFFQDCGSFESAIFPDNLQMLVYAAKACEAPYMLGQGPDVYNFQFTQIGGGNVSLVVTASDDRFNHSNGLEPSQNIKMVQGALDELPQNSASPHGFSPVDGTFDSITESAEWMIDMTSIEPGVHTLYARAQDSDDFWGVVSSMNLYIPHPNTFIEGYVRDADTHLGISAVLTANGFSAQTDPQTGYYRLLLVEGSGHVDVHSPDHLNESRAFTIAVDQHLVENFDLFPYCEVLTEEVESGAPDWTLEAPWSISDETAHQGQYAFSDSPGGNYGNGINVSLESPSLSMTDMAQPVLSFWHRYDFENGYDKGHVEYRIGTGNWTELVAFTGQSAGFSAGDWLPYEAVVPEWEGASDLRVRFRLETDSSVQRDGWYVDFVQIRGAGPSCLQNLTLEDYLTNWHQPYTILDILLFLASQ